MMSHLQNTSVPPSIQRIELGTEKYLVETNISPWTKPAQWLDRNKEDILKNTSCLTCIAYIAQARIYPRLIRLVCDNSRSMTADFESFKSNLSKWNALGPVDLLINAREIQQVLIAHVKDSGISPRALKYQRAFELDLIALWTYILLILSNKDELQTLLSQSSTENVQSVLNLFQSLLNCRDLGGQSRDHVLKALISLSQSTGLYPERIKHAALDKVMKIPRIGSTVKVFEAEINAKAYAVKIFRRPEIINTEKYLKIEQAILKEALILRQLNHANLCSVIGTTKICNRIAIILPWMENGTILQYLKNNLEANRLCLIHDICSGLAYLHSMGVFHGDLKSFNVLVDKREKAQLIDFGLSIAAKDIILATTPLSVAGSSGLHRQYTAPEVMLNHMISSEGDMWSFASTLYEIFTWHPPFHTIASALPFYYKARNGEIPPKPDAYSMGTPGFEEEIWKLMCKCWSVNPGDRPIASEVRALFSQYQNTSTNNYEQKC